MPTSRRMTLECQRDRMINQNWASSSRGSTQEGHVDAAKPPSNRETKCFNTCKMQGKSAIQPASVQMGKIEMCRQTFCQRPLAAGCRSFYRDDHSIASAAEIAAPHPFIRVAKSGKLVLIVMHPVTVIAASLTMPRVRNDMAIL